MKLTLKVMFENWNKLSTKANLSGKAAQAAVEQDGDALKYVKEQTPEICKAAVERNGYALKYVKEQTPEICKAAVEQDGDALCHVKEQIFTADLSVEA